MFRIGFRRGACQLSRSRLSGTQWRLYNRCWSDDIEGMVMVDEEQRGRHDEDGTDDEEEVP
eukprot:scaffold25540_cov37-Cyclotella_meneghiniana.AAC.1